jgi:hypothetical protein
MAALRDLGALKGAFPRYELRKVLFELGAVYSIWALGA